MNFDFSKLDTLPGKASGVKAKPKFGPAIRARPKPRAKPVEAAELPVPATTGTEEAHIVESQQPTDGNARTEAPTAEPRAEAAAAAEPAAEANHLDGAKDIARAGQDTAAEQPPAPAEVRRFKPAAGKRKAPEPPAAAEAVPEPSQAPHVTPDGDAMAIVPVEEEDADTQSDNGPMTKAKKRKGMGKGSGAPKPKTPLAEQKIDPVSMPLKTIIKIAGAKDKVKAAAAKAARAAAAVAQSSSQQTSPVASHAPEPVAAGVAQMVLDPETGQYIVDPNSINMQAQPREQYSRRANNEEILINSMSHMRREASTRWTPEETEEFYSALGIFGTNFQAVADRLATRMAQQGLLAVKRSRKQVKLKFNKEEKLHPRRIDMTLRGQNAMPEDYIEIIHEIKASRNEVQDDETSYLEAAPQHSAPAHAQQSEGGLNEESTEQQQPQTQAQTMTSRPAGSSRAQTRAATGARAKRGAAVEPHDAGQTSQPQAAEDADASLTQLLGETHGVSVVNDDLDGVYF